MPSFMLMRMELGVVGLVGGWWGVGAGGCGCLASCAVKGRVDGQSRRSRMTRPFMGMTCDMCHVREWGVWSIGIGRLLGDGKISMAASRGMISPSWTLDFCKTIPEISKKFIFISGKGTTRTS